MTVVRCKNRDMQLPEDLQRIQWQSREQTSASLLGWLTQRHSQSTAEALRADGVWQRALCLLLSIADGNTLETVKTRFSRPRLSTETRDLLWLAWAYHGAPPSKTAIGEELLLMGRALADDFDEANPRKRWNSSVAKACVRFLSWLSEYDIEACLKGELGGGDARFYGGLYAELDESSRSREPLGRLLLERWFEAPPRRWWRALELALDFFRQHPSRGRRRLLELLYETEASLSPPFRLDDMRRLFPEAPDKVQKLAESLRLETKDLVEVLGEEHLKSRLLEGVLKANEQERSLEHLEDDLERALVTKRVLLARVERHIKGGFLTGVMLDDAETTLVRAFLPRDQALTKQVLVGSFVLVLVIEVDRARRRAVVSQKALLADQAQEDLDDVSEYLAAKAKATNLPLNVSPLSGPSLPLRELYLLRSWEGGAVVLEELVKGDQLTGRIRDRVRIAWCRCNSKRGVEWLMAQPKSLETARIAGWLISKDESYSNNRTLMNWILSRNADPALVSKALSKAELTMDDTAEWRKKLSQYLEPDLDEGFGVTSHQMKERICFAAARQLATWGDRVGLEALRELSINSKGSIRHEALRSLVVLDADGAAPIFRQIISSAPQKLLSAQDHIPFRLALHGLARGSDRSGHDLLLRALLGREDAVRFLPTISSLSGVYPLVPDPFWDDFGSPYACNARDARDAREKLPRGRPTPK